MKHEEKFVMASISCGRNGSRVRKRRFWLLLVGLVELVECGFVQGCTGYICMLVCLSLCWRMRVGLSWVLGTLYVGGWRVRLQTALHGIRHSAFGIRHVLGNVRVRFNVHRLGLGFPCEKKYIYGISRVCTDVYIESSVCIFFILLKKYNKKGHKN